MGSEGIDILFVNDNKDFCDIRSKYLAQQEGIRIVDVAHDGLEAYMKAESLNPDVVVLDGVMPGLEWMWFLEKFIRAQKAGKGAACVILTADKMPPYINRIMKTMTAGRHNDGGKPPKNFSTPNLESRVADVLHKAGVPPHILGYHYLREAIVMVVGNPELVHYITKELYPSVAKKYDTTPVRVERAIRHAIETVWVRGLTDSLCGVFGCGNSERKAKPTNSEFIALLAERLRLAL